MLALCLLLFALVFGTFLPVLHCGFIDVDDGLFVIRNPYIAFTPHNLAHALFHGEAANWHPITQWSLMFDHRLYGLNPWGYHLTNILFHAANAVLLFLALRALTGATGRSFLAAALFGLHPLRVQSVAWISERKDVLSVMFWLLAIWAYARYARSDSDGPGSESKVRFGKRSHFYWLTLLFFAFGLMSKPMVVTLPGALLLLDYWPLARWSRANARRLVWEKAPFVLLSAVMSAATYVIQKQAGMMSSSLTGLTAPGGARLENVFVSYARYLGKIFWPADLCAIYPYRQHWPVIAVIGAVLLFVAVSIGAGLTRRRWPWGLTGWFWFVGTLVPVIGLVQVGTQSMADRYSYIPSIGILIALVWGGFEATQKWRFRGLFLGVAGAGMMIACILLTRQQIGYWKDDVTLWQRAVLVTRNNFDAHDLLGRAWFAQGRMDEAIQEFQEAARLNTGFAEAQNSLGHAFAARGQMAEAIACYRKALAIEPDSIVAHLSLGNLFLKAGRANEAVPELLAAARLNPRLAAAQDSLGRAYMIQRNWAPAIAAFRSQVAIEPDSAEAWSNLGMACAQAGEFEDALAAFTKAVAQQPDDAAARNNLGYLLLRTRQPAQAAAQFRAALQLQPDNAASHNNLGNAFLAQGQWDAAIAEFQEALRLQPDYADARHNLAYVQQLKAKTASPDAIPAAH